MKIYEKGVWEDYIEVCDLLVAFTKKDWKVKKVKSFALSDLFLETGPLREWKNTKDLRQLVRCKLLTLCGYQKETFYSFGKDKIISRYFRKNYFFKLKYFVPKEEVPKQLALRRRVIDLSPTCHQPVTNWGRFVIS